MTDGFNATEREKEILELRAENERLRSLSENNAHSWDAIVKERDELRVLLTQMLKSAEYWRGQADPGWDGHVRPWESAAMARKMLNIQQPSDGA